MSWKTDFRDDVLDTYNRLRSFLSLELGILLSLDIGYTSLILFQCRTRAGGDAGFIRKLHSFPRRMFFLRIIARATKPISHSFPFSDHLILAFIFSLIASSFRSTSSFLATSHFPVKFRRCSFKSAFLLGNIISFPSFVYNLT